MSLYHQLTVERYISLLHRLKTCHLLLHDMNCTKKKLCNLNCGFTHDSHDSKK